VIRFVSFGGKAAPVPEDEIHALRRVANSNVKACPFIPYLEIGQKVQVRKGPLCGITGRLISVKNRTRLLLCVEIVMKALTVDVDITDVIPLDPPGCCQGPILDPDRFWHNAAVTSGSNGAKELSL
jgi:transcription antitermination factor NusG